LAYRGAIEHRPVHGLAGGAAFGSVHF